MGNHVVKDVTIVSVEFIIVYSKCVTFLSPSLSGSQAITIIGPPECCTEACYQIMKIMQNELLMNNGMLENG